jgi:hypothetical protein
MRQERTNGWKTKCNPGQRQAMSLLEINRRGTQIASAVIAWKKGLGSGRRQFQGSHDLIKKDRSKTIIFFQSDAHEEL